MMTHAQLLKEHELKATIQRLSILDVIETYGHIAIEAIYQEVSRIHPSLSLATIYKNIITMVSKGVLVEVPIVGQKPKYEIKKDDHIHLVCTKCGSVMDTMFDDLIEGDTKKIADEADFTLDHRQMNLYGVCGKCAG